MNRIINADRLSANELQELFSAPLSKARYLIAKDELRSVCVDGTQMTRNQYHNLCLIANGTSNTLVVCDNNNVCVYFFDQTINQNTIEYDSCTVQRSSFFEGEEAINDMLKFTLEKTDDFREKLLSLTAELVS